MLSRPCSDTNLTLRLLTVLALLSSTVASNAIPLVKASPAEIRAINPVSGGTDFKFYTNTTLLESRFNVTLYVHNVTDLYAFQACLKYDPSVLDPTRAWIPEDDSEYVFHDYDSIPLGPYFYYDDPNYGTSILMGSTLLASIEGFDGIGLLAIVEFEIIDVPNEGEALSCDLDINNSETSLIDSEGIDIQATKVNGYYEYKWTTPLTYLLAEPRVYRASTLESFNITVWLNNTYSFQNLTHVRFSLSYDSTLLEVTQVMEGNFLAEFGDTTLNHTIEKGSVAVENYLNQPYLDFPEGDGEIAVITFQGIYQDIIERRSSLKLLDTQFMNSTGGMVSAIPINGAYEIAEITGGITMNVHSDDWVKGDNKYVIVQGAEVVLNGSITPVKGGANVTVYCRSGGIEEWRRHIETDSNGHYEHVWETNQTSSLGSLLEFQAKWEEGLDVIAESNVWAYLEIRTEVQSEITITINPKTVVVGRNVTIRGAIVQFESTPHAPVNVTISYRLANETDGWIEIVTVQTDSEGRYSCQWPTPEIGSYKLKASWLGDLPLYEGDESDEVSLEVVETAPLDVMAYLPYIVGVIVVFLIAAILYFKKFRKS